MDTFDFVIIGAGPAGEAAAHKARELGAERRDRRPPLVRRQVPAHRVRAVEGPAQLGGSPCREPGRLRLGARLGAARLHGQPPADADEPDDSGHVTRPRGRRGAAVPRIGRIVGRGRVAVTPRRRDPRARRPERRRRGRVDDEGAAARRDRRRPVLDEPRGDPRPRAADAACSCWAADRPAASSPRSTRGSASRRRSSSRVRGSCRPTIRATPRPSRAALARDGVRVRLGVRAIRARAGAGADGAHAIDLDDGTTAEGHAVLLAVGRDVPPRRPRARALRARRLRTGRRSRATAGSGSPTGCGSSATRRAPSCTRTRATTRASSPSGWRSASRSCPTTGPCPGRPTPTRRRPRSG